MPIKTKLTLSLLFIFFISCSKVSTINLKGHHQGKRPKVIIWLQVPGLDSEHLSLIKFNREGPSTFTSFEESSCIGEAWGYNFYNLRPNARASFLTQISGSKNINLNCSDYSKVNLFSLFDKFAGRSFVLEIGVDENDSFADAWKCKDENEKLSPYISLFKMDKGNEKNDKTRFFHFQENRGFKKGVIYYDKSCQNNNCYSSVIDNIQMLWRSRDKTKNFFVLMIRDYRLLNAFKKKNIMLAKEVIYDIEKVYRLFQKKVNKVNKEDGLVLLTSAESQKIDYPSAGRKWFEMEKNGKNVFYKEERLLSPVYATGRGAENFCGIYEESEILRRIFWSPKSRFINLDKIKLFFNK